MYETTLVLPDSHVEPGQDLSRFEWLGHLLCVYQPDNIVQMGDFIALGSLSAWDKHRLLSMEGKRYHEEMMWGRQAIQMMLAPVEKMNNNRRRSKIKLYQPNVYWLIGNHEDRISAFIEENPVMSGHVDLIQDLNVLSIPNSTIIPYRGFCYIDGVAFTHIPMTRNGRPLQGMHITEKALDIFASSIVFAHTHKLEMSSCYRYGAEHLAQAVTAGCFFEHFEDYLGGAPASYWRGVLVLKHTSKGRFDIETVSLRQMKEMFG